MIASIDTLAPPAGADDNASGVAGVLELARRIPPRPRPRTLLLACWDQEEEGLLGSRAFVASLEGRVHAHFTLEMIASASDEPNTQRIPEGLQLLFPSQVEDVRRNRSRGNFIAVIADAGSAHAAGAFGQHARALALPVMRLDVPKELEQSDATGHLRRSDHDAFWSAGLPSVMLTDTAEFRNPAYHCSRRQDELAGLNADFATKVVSATAEAVEALLGTAPLPSVDAIVHAEGG